MMNMTSIIDHKWPKPSALFLHLRSPPLYSACLLPAAWIVAALSVWALPRTKRQLAEFKENAAGRWRCLLAGAFLTIPSPALTHLGGGRTLNDILVASLCFFGFRRTAEDPCGFFSLRGRRSSYRAIQLVAQTKPGCPARIPAALQH